MLNARDFLERNPDYRVELEPMFFGARIIVTNCYDVDFAFEYASLVNAREAMVTWLLGDDDEPTGWHRAQGPWGSRMRRRPDGDPSKEYEGEPPPPPFPGQEA